MHSSIIRYMSRSYCLYDLKKAAVVLQDKGVCVKNRLQKDKIVLGKEIHNIQTSQRSRFLHYLPTSGLFYTLGGCNQSMKIRTKFQLSTLRANRCTHYSLLFHILPFRKLWVMILGLLNSEKNSRIFFLKFHKIWSSLFNLEKYSTTM